MNILYMAHRIPFPPDKGDKIRSFHQLEWLCRRHDVWCACFVDDPADQRYAAQLRAYCREVAAVRLGPITARFRAALGWAGGRTITESYYAHGGLRRAIARWRKNVRFDAVIAFSSSMAPHALRVPADRRVLDLCDLDSLKWRDCADRATGPRAWLLRSEAGRLAERERRWVDAFDASVLISEAEAATLDDDRRLREKVHVVTNGVDLPDEWMSTAPNRLPGAPPVASRVGFVGMMNYAPNVDAVCWFARECWPAIRRAIPDATFRIVGRAPSSAVRRLETIPGVEVTGPVDDVVAELAEIDVSVAPMRIARGVQNKILEAMAASRAVVLTRAAALGIAARDGHDFVVADAPTEIAQRIVDLLQDDKRRSRIGRNARRYVALNHRWEAAMLPFELIATGRIERTATARTTLHARDSLRREPPVEIDR